MTPHDIAQIYVDLVRLEESLAPDQWQAREEVTLLRSKYRFDAARKAFELIGESAPKL